MRYKRLFILFLLFTTYSCAECSQEMSFKKERDRRIYSALKKFTTLMKAKGYPAVGIGGGIDHSNGKQNYIGVTFDIDRLPDINFARKIEVEALQALLKCINSEEGIQDYIVEYPYRIKFLNISFISKLRTENIYIVGNFEDEIYYLKAESPLPGPPIEVHCESYEKAIQILAQQKEAPAK